MESRTRNITPPGDILVAEPDVESRAFMCRVLRQGGFRVRSVVSAEEVLAAAAAQEPPPLVILDVRLSGVSGYEACRALREQYKSAVLIMFVSADRTEPFDRTAGLLIGADDYLTKPIDADELLARVHALLRRGEVGTGGEAATRNSGALTARELEVLRLLAGGLGQEAIAEGLVITPKTVGKHIERILFKLPARSRAEAVAIAYRRGLHKAPNAEIDVALPPCGSNVER